MKKSVRKLLSIFLSITVLLACYTVAFAADVTVTSSVADDSYLKVGENVVLTFSEAITAEAAAKITVTKVGDAQNTNLVANATVDGANVTLSFGDNLEYSRSYKITVPTGVTTAETTSYFTTYNKYYRGVETVIVDENFNSVGEGNVPAKGTQKNTNIGTIKGAGTALAGDSEQTGTDDVKVTSVNNEYGVGGKALLLQSTSTTSAQGAQQTVYIENYNERVKKIASGRLVVSFKYKSTDAERIYALELRANDGTNKKFMTLAYQGNGTNKYLKTLDATKQFSSDYSGGDWHEITMEWDTSDADNPKCVYVSLDGEALENTQNVVSATYVPVIGNFSHMWLVLQEWGKTGLTSGIYLDDVKVYEPSALSATTVTAQSDVTEDSADVKLTFINPIDTDTLSDIKVTDEGGKTVTYSAKASNDLKTVALSLTGLDAGATYTVSVPETVKDVFANAVTANTFEMTTDKSSVENPLLTIGTPVIGGTVAAGNTLTATAQLSENTTSANVNVTLAVVLYNGIKAEKVVTEKTVFARNTTGTISAELTVPENIDLKNYEVRAFVLDDDLNALATAARLIKQ